jgi:hypothetical protein
VRSSCNGSAFAWPTKANEWQRPATGPTLGGECTSSHEFALKMQLHRTASRLVVQPMLIRALDGRTQDLKRTPGDFQREPWRFSYRESSGESENPGAVLSEGKAGAIPGTCVGRPRWPLASHDVGGWENPGAGPSRQAPRHTPLRGRGLLATSRRHERFAGDPWASSFRGALRVDGRIPTVPVSSPRCRGSSTTTRWTRASSSFQRAI